MHIHILGICGTFMGGIASIARAKGHRVTGSDQNVYPPMSDLLDQQGIELMQGYSPDHLGEKPDLVLIGNTLSRGNPAVETVLNTSIPYMSAPEWLRHNVLVDKHVLAVAGTHGKTTTTTILSWILEAADLNPGFLIGGVAENFGLSARYTDSEYFVIEADEYDTAFFDKRSKFIHYLARTLIISNIEFDHADIFCDIADIRREFQHMIRTLPETGKIIAAQGDANIDAVLNQECYTPVEYVNGSGADWQSEAISRDYSTFLIQSRQHGEAEVNWSLIGRHNANNATAAVAAAAAIGIKPEDACRCLSEFKSVKRRLECIAEVNGITIYDDFAHHPTAIKFTLEALREKAGNARIFAVMEPRSNTMKMGTHQDTLAKAFVDADKVLLYQSNEVKWDIHKKTNELGSSRQVFTNIDDIIQVLVDEAVSGEQIVIMSNGGFGGIHQKLIQALKRK